MTEINALAGEIAKLNEEIHGSEAGVLVANEQRDRRELLIKQLSEKIDITPLDEMDGQISITLGDGTPLILGEAAFQLSTALNGGNHSFREVLIDQGAAGPKNITAAIQGGTLRGYLDMRDRELAQVIGRLDLLAAGFTREFNRVHQQGFGLDGALASVNQSRAIIGANLRLAENTEFTHAQDIVDQTVQLSNIEDADLVKSAADLARLEQALQATLSSTARILQPTLLDFLR